MQAFTDVYSITLDLTPVIDMTVDEFFGFCQANPDLHIERNASGEILLMPPEGGFTGNRTAAIIAALVDWANMDGTGVAFGPSAGFVVPNGAIRSPDAAWVRRDRLAGLTLEQKERFLPLCPDFVVEVRSPSDRLPAFQAKMAEYIDGGAQLGWLLDPPERTVYVYRPTRPVERDYAPDRLHGDPDLPGFTLYLTSIWQPNF
jgi:Uma2 family endonuclease